ncbi:MAG: DUF2752 domain-containing protein [Phycisphaerales bacterium]
MLRVAPATRLPRAQAWVVVLYARWGAGVATVFVLSRATGIHADLCPLHRMTGLPCPFCGGTRTVFLLASLHPLDALAMNPMVALALPALVLALVTRFATARTLHLDAPPERRHAITRALTLAAAMLLLVNWVYLLAYLPDTPA